MDRVFAALYLVILAGCAHMHIIRAPAQEKAADLCERAFAEAVRSGIWNPNQDDRLARSNYFKYYSEILPKQIADFMSRAANKPSCEDELNVDNYHSDLFNAYSKLSERLDDLPRSNRARELLNGPLFQTPGFAKKFECMSRCMLGKGTYDEKFSKCAGDCGLERYGLVFYIDHISYGIQNNCVFQSPDGHLTEVANRRLPQLKAELEEYSRIYDFYHDQDSHLQGEVRELESKYSDFERTRQASQCTDERLEWKDSVRRASIRVPISSGNGSAFFAQTPAGRFLVTAAHVPGLAGSDRRSSIQSDATSEEGMTNRQEHWLEISPGSTDIGRDVIFQKQSSSGPSLNIIKAGIQPRLGQRFYVTGFPGAAEGQFKIFRCKFAGYSARLHGATNAAYQLSCPGRPRLGGISGGAAVDENGVVWGVNVSQDNYTPAFRISPIAVNESGEIEIGFKQPFLSDLCYGSWEFEPHRCQVMPEMFEKDIP